MKNAMKMLVVSGTLALATGEVSAQENAGSLLREQEAQQQRLAPSEAPEPQELITDPFVPPVEAEAETVRVTALRFTGKTQLLSQAQRAELENAVVGQSLGIRGLQALAARVTSSLQQQGHILASAILPPQDVTEGEVTLHLREGVLEEVRIESGDGVRMHAERLQAIVAKSLENEVSRESLEEGLLRLNDLPGVTARGRLAPGGAANSSRLYVLLEEDALLGASLYANNYGVASAGDVQTVATLAVSNASGYGDLSAVTLSASQGQTYASLGSSLPLGASGISARARYSHLDYEHSEDPGEQLGLEGEARSALFGLGYSVIRSRRFNLALDADYEQGELVDDSLLGKLQDKIVDTVHLGASADYRDTWLGGGVTVAALALTLGELDLSGAPAALAVDQASLETDGSFRLWSLDVNRYQSLPGDFSLFARFRGQWAGNNLDSSQELSLGGPYGVRGWPVSEAQGDSGMLGSLELRYRVAGMPVEWGQLQLASFYDMGRITINEHRNGVPTTNACGCNAYNLKGAGLSAIWQHSRFSVAATWARGLGGNPGRDAVTGENADGEDSSQQFWLLAGLNF